MEVLAVLVAASPLLATTTVFVVWRNQRRRALMGTRAHWVGRARSLHRALMRWPSTTS